MPSPMNGVQPPYTLPSNVVYFHDWRYVDGGLLQWHGPENKPVSMWRHPGFEALPTMHANWEWVPRGVRIVALPGTMDEQPTITAAQLNETIFFGGSVLHDGGKYRLFYESIHPDGFTNPAKKDHVGHYKYLRYGESDDAYNWRFPDCGHAIEGDTTPYNNVIFDPGAVGYHGGCVFIDPSSTEERYKSIFLGMLSPAGLAKYSAERADIIDPLAVLREGDHRREAFAAYAVFGAVSPDGFQWKLLEEPLLVQHSDTFHACTYDEVQQKYVAYLRSWFYGKRTVARAESSDFRRFGLPEQICWPGPDTQPYETWYSSGYTRMPEAPDYHLMFPAKWSQLDDTFRPHLFSSPDGVVWSQVPGGPVMETGGDGSWHRCGGGMNSLLPLPGGRIGALVGGFHVPHKYPRDMPYGQCGWISWERDRLTALRADREGEFALWPLRFEGRKLVLNFRTQFAGRIQVQVYGTEIYRSFEDCDPISGDKTAQVVSWKGETDLKHAPGESVQLKFRMHNADLFSVRFR